MQISNTLASEDYKEIERLLETILDSDLTLQQMWRLMDQVWDEIGCDSNNLEQDKITTFYKHPVWLLNGFFIEQHELSLQHRHAISDWIVQHITGQVLDFGGGFGTLSRMIVNKSNLIKVDIYEPYPSNFAISQCSPYPSINFVNKLNNKYDCLVSTDVMEHVPDPLELFWQMIDSVNLNGYLIIANCFYPVIKCHLPSTFHFRYSFDEFAEVMGLRAVGLCEGSHATIYQKTSNHQLNWNKIRQMERQSQFLFPWREFDNQYLLPWKTRLKTLLNDPVATLNRISKKFS